MDEWKKIADTNGLYEVSNTGKIRSLNYLGHGKTQLLKAHPDRKGYLRTRIYIKGKRVTLKIHRAVATAFIPNKNNSPEVNHKNGIKTDNHVENLEWVTAHENTLHAYSIGLKEKTREHARRMGQSHKGVPANQSRKTSIVAINVETGEHKYFSSQAEAADQLNLYQGNINKVLKRYRKTTGGYTFQYVITGGDAL